MGWLWTEQMPHRKKSRSEGIKDHECQALKIRLNQILYFFLSIVIIRDSSPSKWLDKNRPRITVTKRSRHKRQIWCASTYMRYLEQSDSQRQKVEGWLPEAKGDRNGELAFNLDRVSSLARWTEFQRLFTQYECTLTHYRAIHSKMAK